jgi:hypothetical protein
MEQWRGNPPMRFCANVAGAVLLVLSASIELVKGSDQTAPIVLAATVEAFE